MTDKTSVNEITGDRITTKRSTVYADNYANIDWSVKQDDHLNLLLRDDADGFHDVKADK